MAERPILVTGATGLLGPYVCAAASAFGAVSGLARNGGDIKVDLTHRDALTAALKDLAPKLAIHAAAWTDVDGCERQPDIARQFHVTATRNLVDALPDDCQLVYISTDQVYPDTRGPHREGGEGPVNAYGQSKLEGEAEALRHARTLVLRTNVFGPSRTEGRASLSDIVQNALAQGAPMTLFKDLLFSPLHLASLSALIFELVEKGATGVLNLGSRDGLSKCDFALAVANHLSLATDSVTIGRSDAIAGRAPRAHDLRLNVTSAESVLGRPLPTLVEEVARL